MQQEIKKSNLFSAIALGVGSIVGSGWLFASYYASQYAGPISILSWIIGAILALSLALLLAEIATMYQETGLFSRLITITHNADFGFIVAISNWFAMVVCITSEAAATVQYIGSVDPTINSYVFEGSNLSDLGTLCVVVLIGLYGVLNYWGIKTLTKVNNIITTIKIIFPLMTAIVMMVAAFHPSNFTSYHNSIHPYGIGKAFSAVVSCGIFYAFYGFSMITIFAKELKKPQKNIPLALGGSVLICLVIYICLQISFIGALPTAMVANGWHQLNFNSPLASLAGILGINWLVIALYADAALSPSGTGIVYAGSGGRMLQAMAEDQQVPKIFARTNHTFFVSRTSLLFSIGLAMGMLLFFDNWQKIMLVVSVFQLISCVAVPVAFISLRNKQPDRPRAFRLPFGKQIAIATYALSTFLLIQSGTVALVTSFIFHVLFFLVYTFSNHGFNGKALFKSFASSWSMFFFLTFTTLFGYLLDHDRFYTTSTVIVFCLLTLVTYFLLIEQKEYV